MIAACNPIVNVFDEFPAATYSWTVRIQKGWDSLSECPKSTLGPIVVYVGDVKVEGLVLGIHCNISERRLAGIADRYIWEQAVENEVEKSAHAKARVEQHRTPIVDEDQPYKRQEEHNAQPYLLVEIALDIERRFPTPRTVVDDVCF